MTFLELQALIAAQLAAGLIQRGELVQGAAPKCAVAAGEILRAVVDRCTEDDYYEIALPRPPAKLCPHGEPLGECVACDVSGDMAFDSARESAYFGGR